MAKDEHFGTQIGWGGIGLWYNALIPLDSPFRSTGGSPLTAVVFTIPAEK